MKCPVCRYGEFQELYLRTEGFSVDIKECRVCGTVWSVNHGVKEVIFDAHGNSFLEVTSECVEADDYSFAV
ncbi:MAG: hypothetical protein P8X63_13605 [Desulfuromonadaceae bacterium]